MKSARKKKITADSCSYGRSADGRRLPIAAPIGENISD